MGMQSCTVLIVDSAPAERRTYRNLLADDPVYHYHILEAEQGTQAVRLCQQTKLDCILLAAHMPDRDSLTLLQTLIQSLGPQGAALIMVVQSPHDDLARQAIQNGAHDYLCKDEMTAHQVQHRIHRTLEKVALQRAVAHQRAWQHTIVTSIDEQLKASTLYEGEMRFRQLADAMPQIVWTTTPAGVVDYFNEQWFAFTGLSIEASLADGNVAIHPDDRAAAMVAWQAAQPEGEAYEYEMRLRRYDGVYHWFLARCVPAYDAQGRLHHWYGTSTDITERKQAEEKLRYQAFLLENVQDAVISTDMNFRIVTWNRGAEQIYGWLAIEVIGRHVGELLQTAYLDAHAEDVLHTFMTNGRWRGEVTQHNQAGEQIIVSNTTVLLHDPQGRPLGAVAVNRDITARKLAEDARRHSEERLRLALAGGRMGIWEWHAATEKSIWNEQEYALFGLPYGTEITLDIFMSLIHPADWPHLKNLLDTTMATGGDYSAEFRIVRAEGEVRWLAEYGVGLIGEHPHSTRLLGINFDITERKVQEEALHQLTIELEARVAERTAALKAINEKLEATNRELEHFTYAAAHDLKSPLRGIQNLVQFLMEDAVALLPAKSQKHLTLLQGRAYRLEQLLNGLLDYSRIGRERYTVETVNTHLLAEEIGELLAQPDGFTITVATTLPTLVTHRAPLATVLHNLLSNAIKHHHQPALGQVHVTARRLDNWVEFSVADNGPGIAPEFHQRIFEMFQTLQSRDIVEGSGIGLALVKKIIESYGGHITVDSALGQGATFRFTWPTHDSASRGGSRPL